MKCSYFKTSTFTIVLFSILLFNSCNELLFEKTMPLAGHIQNEIPAFFNGEFIKIYYSDYKVSANIYEIEKNSNYACQVYKTENLYLDSISWSKTNLGKIDTVVFENNQLTIHGKDSILNLHLSDSITSYPKKIEYKINLKSGHFNINFGNNPIDDTKKEKCELKRLNNNYFLNIQKSNNYWLVVKIKFDGEDILFTPSTFFENDEYQNFENIVKKYNLKDISESNGKVKSIKYLANLNDNEFEEIINRNDIFTIIKWHKIKNNNNNTLYLILMFLCFLITPIIAYYAKEKK